MNQVRISSDRIDAVENDNCSYNFVRQSFLIQNSDKQWAVDLQQIEKPQDEFTQLGQKISLCKINQKSSHEEKLYKFIVEKCSSWSKPTERLNLYQHFTFVQYLVCFNTENILPLETEIVNEGRSRLSMLAKQVFVSVPRAFSNNRLRRIIKPSEKIQLRNPYQKFIPSRSLVDIVRENMIYPDEEELELVREIKKMQTEVVDERQNISNIITKQIEGLFTNVAKRVFRTKKPVRITKDKRFTHEICNDLIDRLGLDVYNSRPVLELLYNEFCNFVSLSPRERSWGSIIAEDSEINLKVKEDAFKFPELSEINNKRTLATITK